MLVAGAGATPEAEREGVGSGPDEKCKQEWTCTFGQAGTDLCAAVSRAPVSVAVEPIGDGHATAEADWQEGEAAGINRVMLQVVSASV